MLYQHIALITGAAAGIGLAIAQKLSTKINALVLVDLQKDRVEQVANDLAKQANISVVGYCCDVGDFAAVSLLINTVKKTIGIPTVLINNAGYGGPFHTLDEVSDEEWQKVFNTNVKSVFNFAKHLLPEMKNQSFGRIVNIASVQGYFGAANSSTYVASKHAVIGYTKAIAAEWGAYGITCNAICPGYVDTQMGIQNDSVNEHLLRVLAKTPAARIATPQEVASIVEYLISNDASFINGTSITIDGGLTCHLGVS